MALGCDQFRAMQIPAKNSNFVEVLPVIDTDASLEPMLMACVS